MNSFWISWLTSFSCVPWEFQCFDKAEKDKNFVNICACDRSEQMTGKVQATWWRDSRILVQDCPGIRKSRNNMNMKVLTIFC